MRTTTMRIPPTAKTGARNLLVLALVFLPVFLLIAGLLARYTGEDQSSDLVGTASVLYAGFILPVLAGGVLYLLALFAAVRRSPSRSRALAVLLTPIIALGMVLFGASYVLTAPHFAIALVAALLMYGILVRVPASV
jgi:hypothetical protein